MVITLRVFWLVTPKVPVTPVILLHNLYRSRHWQPRALHWATGTTRLLDFALT
jgi:hypothetical protein